MILTEMPRFPVLHPDESDTSLVGSWLHNKLANPFNDFSANGNNGTPTDVIAGRQGSTFNGSSSDIDINANPHDMSTAFSLCAWIKISALAAGNHQIVAKSGNTQWGHTNTGVYFYRSDGVSTTGSTLAAGQWYHCGVTYDGTDLTLYLNGAVDATETRSVANTAADLFIGAYTGTSEFFNGLLHDVRLYSDALTADEVLADYRSGVPEGDLVAAWGPDGKDYSVYGLDMTPQADAIVGDRASFDGTGDCLLNSTANWRGPAYAGGADSAGTIILWARRSAIGTSHVLFSTADNAGTSYYLLVDMSNANVLRLQQKSNDTADIVTGSTTLAANQWYHVAVTSNGSAWTMYVNGTSEGTLTVGSGANSGDWFADTTNRDVVSVGGLYWNSGTVTTPLNGDIDSVKVYNTAKSADYIKDHYLRTRDRHR